MAPPSRSLPRGHALNSPPPTLDYAAATRGEISALVMRSLFLAHQRENPESSIEALFDGLPIGRDYVEDPRNWLSFALVVELLERFAAANSPGFIRRAGRLTISHEALGLTYVVMRSVGSPRLLYDQVFSRSRLYNRVGRMDVLDLGTDHAVLLYVPTRPEFNDHPLIVEHRLGQFEAMPTVFGLPLAHIESQSEALGDVTAIRYRLRWVSSARSVWWDPRLWFAALVFGACGAVANEGMALDMPALPIVTMLLGMGVAAQFIRRESDEGQARKLVDWLDDALTDAHTRHDELRAANLELHALRGALEERVESQDAELRRRFEALQASHAALQQVASHDGLTGLLTRRAGDEALAGYVEAYSTGGGALSVLLFDVDDFKRVNDLFGHAAGDDVLRRIGEVMAHTFPHPMLCVRYGGDEFMVVLAGRGRDDAHADARALAVHLRQPQGFAWAPSFGPKISGGVAELQPGESPSALVQRADALLYAAKARGRDQIASEVRSPDRGPTPAWINL